MPSLFGPAQRALQDRFDTRRIADRIEAIAVATALAEPQIAFIESRDMMFVSTVGEDGFPTCSYKGGEPGFVRVIDPATIVFPSYDGNGMFLSAGNIAASSRLGLLFIDFSTPNRLRVQGTAALVTEGPLLGKFAGAELVVQVAVDRVWPNCPRYVHRYEKMAASRYVPKLAADTPLAEWKRIDLLQEDLPRRDIGRVGAAGGTITMEEWQAAIGRGEG